MRTKVTVIRNGKAWKEFDIEREDYMLSITDDVGPVLVSAWPIDVDNTIVVDVHVRKGISCYRDDVFSYVINIIGE